ncbi:hypothetical protein KCV87_32110 [Actinosynnema pretiosum subsp. pretiosum]|uniref:Uncharacterized protein n=1 Tax=Actinosynnema pretiosum subsp. pretiosum TaxID=103721 RepID=A0AA45R3N7_9PSEU|nr:hypothetical protein KCV87_32110 [Actinosynnema pretiosum subsp. pretiosum]
MNVDVLLVVLLGWSALVLAIALSGTKGRQRIQTIHAVQELLVGVGNLFVETVRMILPPYRVRPDRVPDAPVELPPRGEAAPDSPPQGTEPPESGEPLDGGASPRPVDQ